MMGYESTSVNFLNADRPLRRWHPLYRALLRVDAAWPHAALDPQLRMANYRCSEFDTRYAACPAADSPGRKAADMFCMDLPWEAMRAELGDIRLLDIGCGRGGYARLLQAWSGGRIAGYRGIDIAPHDEWESVAREWPEAAFQVCAAESVAGVLDAGTSMLFSQSALEHISGDLALFRQIAAFAESRRQPVLQLHVVPAAAAAKIYPGHGIRYYTTRLLSKITRLFSAFSECRLIALGGEASVRVHREYITDAGGGTQKRHADPGAYDAACREALRADMDGENRSPIFYALVIHSHPRSELF